MIILKTLKWSNTFSYGSENVLHLDQNQITQLLGKNGHGKSSIGLILEEVLYNKNSKGIKKGDILNRYVKDKAYSIELEFEKDGVLYLIKTTRGTTQTVKFFRDNEDVSAHTATNTFKLIEDTLGLDQKSFSQLVYQSSANSLEFLTATDTNRKKFLIDLLNLSKYVEAFETFKAVAKTVSDEVLELETKIKTTQTWLDKHSKIDLTEKPILPQVQQPSAERTELAEVQSKLKNIVGSNKSITQNNQYIKLRDEIPSEYLAMRVEPEKDTKTLLKESIEAEATIKSSKAYIKKVEAMPDNCPTCNQPTDKSAFEAELASHKETVEKTTVLLADLKAKIKEAEDHNALVEKVAKYKSDYESYNALINPDLPTSLFDKDELDKKVKELQDIIDSVESVIKDIEAKNKEATAHNSKISVVVEQMGEMTKELAEYSGKLAVVADRLNTLQLLQKTFSTNGLIAYKIECLVKDLEELTNKYLSELSDGRFQISFKVVSDKLNVVITDNGKDIEILALSSGEKARVNTATLLAIRKLMQSLSNARINLLILDETIENLDTEGKERLIEVLLQEEHLNTILISHGFQHPLLEKINVVKTNNISRIEV